MIYILASIIAVCLASAQAFWGSAVKSISSISPNISSLQLIERMLANPKFYIGATLYILSTLVYFVLLSKAKFFSVQLTMTGVAVVLALLISIVFFKEQISVINILGVFLILLGVILVTN